MEKSNSIVISPQKGKQELSLNIKADVVIVGGAAGSGKSQTLLMKSLCHLDDPNYRAIYFRKTIKQLEGSGGLWPEAKKMYRPFGVTVREQQHELIFPSGAKVTMGYMGNDNDAEMNNQGLQFTACYFDELTHFSLYQFLYLIGRLRSDADIDSFCMASCNPSPDSFVYDWVKWYLNDEGYPDETKCGKIRYFVIVDSEPVFADTEEELAEMFPELCYIDDPETGETRFIAPMSFSFVSANIFDNPALIKKNPKYLANLKAQTPINRKRLLDGNWTAREEGSNYFQREWLINVDSYPANAKCCRAWDKGSTEPCEQNPNPDYTAMSPRIYMNEGLYYIVWDAHPDTVDKKDSAKWTDLTRVTGRFRLRSGERDMLILKQAKWDSESCHIILPIDPGAAGKVEWEHSAKALTAEGFIVKKDPMPNNKSKILRFQPFATACQNGLVRVVKSSFPNKETYEAYVKELESFTGERSTANRKDDFADATASSFNYISKMKTIRDFTLPTLSGNNATVLSALKF